MHSFLSSLARMVQECAFVFVPLLLDMADSLGQVPSYLQPESLLLTLQSRWLFSERLALPAFVH